MRLLSIPTLICGFALTICGCPKPPVPPPALDPDAIMPMVRYSRPLNAPQFNPLDFTIVRLDRNDEQYVVLCRPLFKETVKTGQETFTRIVKDTINKEVVDENGKKITKVEEVERPEVRTREVTYTVFEVEGDGFYRSPINKLKAFDMSGVRLSDAALREALQYECRAVLHAPDSTPESFYGSFFSQYTIFLQGEDWVQIPPFEIESF